MELQEVTLADLPAVERLSLEQFPTILNTLQVPFETLLDVLVRLRLADPRPTEGIFVLKIDSVVAGMIFVDTPDRPTISLAAQWRCMRPLGLRKALHLLFILRFKVYHPKSGEAYLNGIATQPSLRRQGLANLLTEYAENYARQCGNLRIMGYVASTNTASKQLMLKRGWQLVEPQSWFGRWNKRRSGLLRMEKHE